jgi:DNA-binding transcriptional LysR family regulator
MTKAMELTLSQLECFVATLETGSFTAAADALDISQPAVAEQVQRLERSVGQSLFARQARGVRPTRAAAELEPHARRVLDAARAAALVVSEADTVGRGAVAFGTFGSPHHYGLAALIRGYIADHPQTHVRIVGQNSSSTADAVRSGALDAAVVALPVDDASLDVRPLFVGEVVYVSADRARTRRPVPIEALAERPLILYESSAGVADPTRRQLAARAQAAGVLLRPRVEVESADTALELAADGVGDTYAPQILKASLDRRLSTVSFDPPLADTFALIVRAGSRLSRPVQDFVDRVTTHLLSSMAVAADGS